MEQQLCLMVVLSALLSLSTCSMICITSTSMDDDGKNSSCVTLNQFASSTYDNDIDSSITLMLEPGNHTLNVTFSIFNISEFRMVSSDSTNAAAAVVLCESQGQFIIEKVDVFVIDRLTFVGCKEKTFTHQLSLDDAMVFNTEKSTAVLVLRGVTLAKVYNSAFLFNRAGSPQFESFDNNVGAIISNLASKLSINDSIFEHNNARVLYSDLGSSVTLNRCRFLRNSAAYGGLIYANNSRVRINECTFSHNDGEAGFRVLFLFNGLTNISETNFTSNSEVILALFNHIKMVGCHFDSNYVPKNASSIRLTYDTYDAIVVVISSFIAMTQTSFYVNEAIENGGILVTGNATIIYNDMEFVNNKGFEGTIVMISSKAIFDGTVKFNSNKGSISAVQSGVKVFGHVLFLNGTPSTRDRDIIRGGAVTLYFSILNITGPYARAEFVANYAINGGALNAAESIININAETAITDNVADAVGGGIFMYRTSLIILARVNISLNHAWRSGGGIYAESASITVTSSQNSTIHSVVVTNNEAAENGGGLYFSSNARLYVYQLDPRHHNITVILTSNSAQNGGAIFVNDETNTGVCDSSGSMSRLSVTSECFFQVVDLYRQNGILKLVFESNNASKGSVMYGGLLDRCRITVLTNSSFFDTNLGSSFAPSFGLSYFKNVSKFYDLNSIASDPVKLCFCNENNTNCSIHVQTRQIEKGNYFNVSVAALDQAGHMLSAPIIAELLPTSTGSLGDGQQSQVISDACTTLTYSVTSFNDNETIMLYADGPCRNAGPSIRIINVTFSECTCPIGFQPNLPNASKCECVCDSKLEGKFIQNCTIESETFTKVNIAWINYSIDTGFIISRYCPYDYCIPSMAVNLNTVSGSNVQCANNRAGDLCGGCQPKYSLSLDQTSCVLCDNIWPVYTVLITLAALMIGIFIVMMVLFLNLTVTTGTINGFFFSANILRAIFPFPSNNYQTYLISFLNLEIGLNVCYYDGFDTYVKTWFQLGFPFYLVFIVVMVIIISRYSTTFARCIGKRNPIETLATLIFLSYSKLLQFPVTALSYAELKYPNGSVFKRIWFPDARVGYFDAKHTVMFIAAYIVTVLVIVYTLLLLFWQWIVKLPNWKIFALIRNTKVQSFIEMYHIPYNNNHRYWTGLLLLMRIIVYMVTLAFGHLATYLAVVLMLSALFIIKSLSVRVYKRWPVDVLESVLIVNTIALAAVASYTSITKDKIVPHAATYLSTIVMGTLLVAVIVYHLHTYVMKGKVNYKKRLLNLTRRSKPTEPSNENEDHSQQQESLSDNPRRLNVDRFHSLLVVMGDVSDSDYHELHNQQEVERNAEIVESDQDPVVPAQPTFSTLEVPFSRQRYVPYNGNN